LICLVLLGGPIAIPLGLLLKASRQGKFVSILFELLSPALQFTPLTPMEIAPLYLHPQKPVVKLKP
jgi:hypothetical protein